MFSYNQTAPGVYHDGVKMEIDPNYNRDVVTIKSGTNTAGTPIPVCTLLSKLTATGKYVLHDPVAADPVTGSEIVAGIMMSSGVDAGSADQTAVVLVRGPALIDFDNLVQGIALDAGGVTAAKADLLALGIKCI
jgi:hypothetical protein